MGMNDKSTAGQINMINNLVAKYTIGNPNAHSAVTVASVGALTRYYKLPEHMTKAEASEVISRLQALKGTVPTHAANPRRAVVENVLKQMRAKR